MRMSRRIAPESGISVSSRLPVRECRWNTLELMSLRACHAMLHPSDTPLSSAELTPALVKGSG
jgi:hypothetical protein